MSQIWFACISLVHFDLPLGGKLRVLSFVHVSNLAKGAVRQMALAQAGFKARQGSSVCYRIACVNPVLRFCTGQAPRAQQPAVEWLFHTQTSALETNAQGAALIHIEEPLTCNDLIHPPLIQSILVSGPNFRQPAAGPIAKTTASDVSHSDSPHSVSQHSSQTTEAGRYMALLVPFPPKPAGCAGSLPAPPPPPTVFLSPAGSLPALPDSVRDILRTAAHRKTGDCGASAAHILAVSSDEAGVKVRCRQASRHPPAPANAHATSTHVYSLVCSAPWSVGGGYSAAAPEPWAWCCPPPPKARRGGAALPLAPRAQRRHRHS